MSNKPKQPVGNVTADHLWVGPTIEWGNKNALRGIVDAIDEAIIEKELNNDQQS